MRRTRQTVLTAIILLAGCATDDNRLGGDFPQDPAPDAGTGSGGAAAGGSGGTAGSGGTSNPTGGSGGTAGGDLGASSDTYTAFVDQIITSDRLVLHPAKCMPRQLDVGADGKVACVVTQAELDAPDCGCTAPGTRPAPAGVVATVRARLEFLQQCGGTTGRSCESYCLCQLDQFTGAAEEQCRTSPSLTGTDAGWCYVDPEQGIGDPAVVASCPASQRRQMRFGSPSTQAGLFTSIACAEHDSLPSLGPARSGAIGEACIPSSEAVTTFSGFSNWEVSVEIGSRQCSSGLCLSNHFSGRVTCPYGQPDPTVSEPECAVPGSGNPVIVAVEPQETMRRSRDAVYCSCRCAGPGPGPFCACPNGFSCTPLVPDMGLPASSAVEGSYCVKQGTEFDLRTGPLCDRRLMNCE